MFKRLFQQPFQVQRTQVRMSSDFNKYPVLKVKPLGISGNVVLAVGIGALITATYIVQKSGFLIPRVPGLGLRSPRSLGMEMDLTPDELKQQADE